MDPNQSKLKSSMVKLLNKIETMWATKKQKKTQILSVESWLFKWLLSRGLWSNPHITGLKIIPETTTDLFNSLLIVVKKKHFQKNNSFGFTYPADIFSGMCFPHLPMTTDPSFSDQKKQPWFNLQIFPAIPKNCFDFAACRKSRQNHNHWWWTSVAWWKGTHFKAYPRHPSTTWEGGLGMFWGGLSTSSRFGVSKPIGKI